MTEQLDLLSYPNQPGWKRTDTSEAAAESVKPSAATLRERCLANLRKVGPGTADEIAIELEEEPFSIRPRFTELLRMGLIEDSGARRKNASGRNAIVWRLAQPKTASRGGEVSI